jgi:glycosyltransferase involved in cell wall biosynthesis
MTPGGRPERAMRVLHLLAPAPRGGLESVVRSLAVGLSERGHDMTVAAVVVESSGSHAFVEESRAAGIDVREVVAGGRSYRAERRAVAGLLGELHADLLHCHGYRPDVVDAGVARRAGLPVVSTVHGFTGGDWKNRLYERLDIRALKRFDAVVAVSEPIRARLLRSGVPRDRVHLVANAWTGVAPLSRAEARRRLGLPTESLVVGWVGRLSEEKGPDLAVRAMESAPPDVSLSFIGDGPERERLQSLAENLKLSGRIRFHGAIGGAGALVGAFDVLMLSSRTEGTPMVVFEAMAAGVPIVAAAVGGVPAALGDGGGRLVEPGSPPALGRAVAATIVGSNGVDPDRLARRVREGRLAWLSTYEALYASLLDREAS